jgi:transposase, IS5 family
MATALEDSMRRGFGQHSLADGLVSTRSGALDRIAGLVDWTALEALLGDVHAAPVGRPGYGPLVLLRCVLLQQWYELSDPGLEEALSDRLSFRRFVGLSLSDPVPDHSTLSRFRKVLAERQLGEKLLAELNRQLDARGLILKRGTLVDASLIEANARRPRKGEPKVARSDQDATWTAMKDEPHFGYKRGVAERREAHSLQVHVSREGSLSPPKRGRNEGDPGASNNTGGGVLAVCNLNRI